MRCDANIGNHRYEAYHDGTYTGAADTLEDANEYEGCGAGTFLVIDTEMDIAPSCSIAGREYDTREEMELDADWEEIWEE